MTIRNYFVPFGLKPKKLSDGLRYGDANDRMMASAIDVMLLYVLLHRITEYINAKLFIYYNMQSLDAYAHVNNWKQFAQMVWESRGPLLATNGIFVLMIGLLLITCQMAYRTTPGKWLLGLRIVRHETLEPIARWRYIVRFFAYFVSCVPAMLGIVWMNFNKQRRGWHDYMAGTVVINTRPRGWLWLQVKRGFRKLRGKPLLVEQPVSEPAAEQRHGDGDKPIK